jgi:predicted nuclease of restriction endonuclease-like (RecB) superfamily
VENEAARNWYMAETAAEGWSTRALERQINSFYYERLLSSQDRQPVRSEAIQQTAELSPRDILKDPYVLEFLEMGERGSFTESELESALIGQLQGFLLELGKGFSFVARQRRIDLEGERFYIDLVFYNYLLKCFVLIDLKLGKLTHQDIGQMDTYVRMYEERFRGADDNPTLGLILCSERNEAIAKYSVLAESQQIFASKYRLVLPTEEELVAGLRGIMKEIIEQAFPERSRMGAPLDSWRIFEVYGGGVRLRSPTPDRGSLKEVIEQAFPERSRMGAPLKSWNSLKSMGGGVRLRSPTPDRGSLKETIKRAFPERSRMGAPLDSWRIFEVYGGWGSATLTHPRSRASQGNH